MMYDVCCMMYAVCCMMYDVDVYCETDIIIVVECAVLWLLEDSSCITCGEGIVVKTDALTFQMKFDTDNNNYMGVKTEDISAVQVIQEPSSVFKQSRTRSYTHGLLSSVYDEFQVPQSLSVVALSASACNRMLGSFHISPFALCFDWTYTDTYSDMSVVLSKSLLVRLSANMDPIMRVASSVQLLVMSPPTTPPSDSDVKQADTHTHTQVFIPIPKPAPKPKSSRSNPVYEKHAQVTKSPQLAAISENDSADDDNKETKTDNNKNDSADEKKSSDTTFGSYKRHDSTAFLEGMGVSGLLAGAFDGVVQAKDAESKHKELHRKIAHKKALRVGLKSNMKVIVKLVEITLVDMALREKLPLFRFGLQSCDVKSVEKAFISNLTVDIGNLAMQYFNHINDHWEPILEPCGLHIQQTSDTRGGGSLKFSASKVLDVSISSLAIELGVKVANEFASSASALAKLGAVHKYSIINQTEQPLHYWLTDSKDVRDLKVMETRPIRVSASSAYVCIKFDDGSTVLNISIGTKGATLYPILTNQRQRTMRSKDFASLLASPRRRKKTLQQLQSNLICEWRNVNGAQLLSVHSTVCLKNCLDVDVEVLFSPDTTLHTHAHTNAHTPRTITKYLGRSTEVYVPLSMMGGIARIRPMLSNNNNNNNSNNKYEYSNSFCLDANAISKAMDSPSRTRTFGKSFKSLIGHSDGSYRSSSSTRRVKHQRFIPFVLEMCRDNTRTQTHTPTRTRITSIGAATMGTAAVLSTHKFYVCATHADADPMNQILLHAPYVIENLLYCTLSVYVKDDAATTGNKGKQKFNKRKKKIIKVKMYVCVCVMYDV